MSIARALIACAGMMAALSAAMPVHAQLAPGYSGQSSAPRQAVREEVWEMNRVLGQCLVRTKREKAVAYLMTVPDSADEGEAFGKLFSRERNVCMRDFVSATLLRSTVRGTIAEALYEQSVPVPAALAVPVGDEVRTFHDFARCYVRTHGPTAQQLLATTKLGTREETAFVKTMAADFGPCLPEGVEVRLIPSDIRLAFAEALWKSAAVPSASVGEGSE